MKTTKRGCYEDERSSVKDGSDGIEQACAACDGASNEIVEG